MLAESKALGHPPHPKWDLNRLISAQLLPICPGVQTQSIKFVPYIGGGGVLQQCKCVGTPS